MLHATYCMHTAVLPLSNWHQVHICDSLRNSRRDVSLCFNNQLRSKRCKVTRHKHDSEPKCKACTMQPNPYLCAFPRLHSHLRWVYVDKAMLHGRCLEHAGHFCFQLLGAHLAPQLTQQACACRQRDRAGAENLMKLGCPSMQHFSVREGMKPALVFTSVQCEVKSAYEGVQKN